MRCRENILEKKLGQILSATKSYRMSQILSVLKDWTISPHPKTEQSQCTGTRSQTENVGLKRYKLIFNCATVLFVLILN